jgi:hypothetical protein
MLAVGVLDIGVDINTYTMLLNSSTDIQAIIETKCRHIKTT